MSKSLDRTSMWTRMRFLLENLGTRAESGAFVDVCLDVLNDMMGAEQGIILTRTVDGRWRPVVARKNRRAVPAPNLESNREPLLEESLRSGRCAVRRTADITSIAMVLRRGAWSGGGQRTIGAFYFKMSTSESTVQPLHIEFLESVAVLVAVTLDHRERLEAAEENLRAAKAHETGDQGPDLDQILSWDSMTPLKADIQASIIGESSVMILGESGTGKTRLAAAIAQASGRVPIVRATLGASDDLNTITSELFGHERGAYSGAVSKRTGLVEYADGGTLILDEVLNLPPHAQQLLLDFTQFGTYRPLGYEGQEPKRANVRIISATNGNILQSIADTRFRQDLYFRLAGVMLTLPPLRGRRYEVPEIAQQYLKRLDPARSWSLSASARRLLLSEIWEWEGNIRQLMAVMRRARDRAIADGIKGGTLEAKYIGLPARAAAPFTMRSSPPPAPPGQNDVSQSCSDEGEQLGIEQRWTTLQMQRSNLDDMERELIDMAMHENRGVVAHAAKQLNVSRTSLLSRMATLHIDKSRYRR